MSADPYARLRERVVQNALNGAGASDPAVRRAAAEDAALPEDLEGLVHKIHRHAYKVTDEDLALLHSTYGDDQLFEIVVSAALGASEQRLLTGLRALDEACG